MSTFCGRQQVGSQYSAEGAANEHCHPALGDRLAGAELVVHRWVAPAGHACGGELVDVGLEDRTVVIVEQISRTVRSPVSPASEIGRALSALDQLFDFNLVANKLHSGSCRYPVLRRF